MLLRLILASFFHRSTSLGVHSTDAHNAMFHFGNGGYNPPPRGADGVQVAELIADFLPISAFHVNIDHIVLVVTDIHLTEIFYL